VLPSRGDREGVEAFAFGELLFAIVGALTAAAVLRGSLGNIAHVGATLSSGSQGQAF